MLAIKKEPGAEDGKRKGGKASTKDGWVELVPKFKEGKSGLEDAILQFNKSGYFSGDERA